jgi:hypothetical protein
MHTSSSGGGGRRPCSFARCQDKRRGAQLCTRQRLGQLLSAVRDQRGYLNRRCAAGGAAEGDHTSRSQPAAVLRQNQRASSVGGVLRTAGRILDGRKLLLSLYLQPLQSSHATQLPQVRQGDGMGGEGGNDGGE